MNMNERSNKTIFITQAAFIAAAYVVLTFVANAFGLASGVIQIRLSEALCVLCCFTPAAIPGLTIGCLLANTLTGCCLLDIVFGSVATLIGATLGYLIRRYRFLVPVPTILSNAFIVPLVLKFGYGENLPYYYLFATVGAGELISAGALGIIFMLALSQVPMFRRATVENS